ncbi:MAG: alanine--glyoxylate aminotransferase family protein [Akkermansiaceae bacterium]|nr:alanine--glyoxylate aminotransferase family protein [Akkermansiaceae bacterium]
MRQFAQLNPAERILMGPGPSTVPTRVLRALSAPTLGHLDPQYIEIMDETCAMLRQVFETGNQLTFPVSATGMAGMEAIASNLVEHGDEVIVCVNGVFGGRMRDIMERCGATVHAVEAEWGEVITEEGVAEAVQAHPKAKLLTIVHAETSTGVHQPLEGISKIVHEAGMLLVVDAVTSLGGHPLKVDEWKIDAVFSGTQKCLSCPPGLSPVSFSERALETMDSRKTKSQSWYFDVSMLRDYYAGTVIRAYHHTAPINMIYALREALAIVLEEGLENRFERHGRMHRRLRDGLEAMGISYIPKHSLHTLNCVSIPEGVDDVQVRKRLLDEYSIEIGAGLGPFAGKAWRIGLMGHSATSRNVDLLLAVLEEVMVIPGGR